MYVCVCVHACMYKLFCVHAFAMILQVFCSLSLSLSHLFCNIFSVYIQINPLWEIHVALKLSMCTGKSTAATRVELPDPTSVHNA